MHKSSTAADNGSAMSAGSLAGLKVVDLSRVLAGPMCAMILADHGADVIKVEPPDGDETRRWGPPFDQRCGGASYFVGLNRNKRAITLNLKLESDRDRLRELIANADILIENFKTGTMESWGLGHDTLAVSHPKLIYCRISGFGSNGPLAGLAGYDAVLQAMSGLMSVNGTSSTGATKMGAPVVDVATALYSTIGILMAVTERGRSGRGQMIDMTLHDCALAMLHPHATNFLMSGRRPAPMGNSHPNLAPCEKFRTETGEIFIAIGNDNQFAKLVGTIGLAELATDSRFAQNSNRVKNMTELFDILQQALGRLDGQAICEKLLSQNVPAGPVLAVDQALQAEQTRARAMLLESDQYRGVASPIKFSRSVSGLRLDPPSQSEHQALLDDPDGFWI